MNMNKLMALLLAAGMVTSSAWADSLLKPDDRIIFVGDSITAQGVGGAQGYYHQFTNALHKVYPADINPTWAGIERCGFTQDGLEKFAGPGHWNDPDMLEVGNGKLTPDENYTHVTLWCMLASPLLIGCDLTKMSLFVLSVLSNDEVLAVDQDELGRQGWRVRQDGQKEVWMKPLADGSLAVALFNRGAAPTTVSVSWTDLKLTGKQKVRDLWRQTDLPPSATEGLTQIIASHGAELFKVSAADKESNAKNLCDALGDDAQGMRQQSDGDVSRSAL